MCVQGIDVQCVLQFTLINAAGCALHRCTSRVIHRSELSFSDSRPPPGPAGAPPGGETPSISRITVHFQPEAEGRPARDISSLPHLFTELVYPCHSPGSLLGRLPCHSQDGAPSHSVALATHRATELRTTLPPTACQADPSLSLTIARDSLSSQELLPCHSPESFLGRLPCHSQDGAQSHSVTLATRRATELRTTLPPTACQADPSLPLSVAQTLPLASGSVHRTEHPPAWTDTIRPAVLIMILPQVHLRKPCYDFYFL